MSEGEDLRAVSAMTVLSLSTASTIHYETHSFSLSLLSHLVLFVTCLVARVSSFALLDDYDLFTYSILAHRLYRLYFFINNVMGFYLFFIVLSWVVNICHLFLCIFFYVKNAR